MRSVVSKPLRTGRQTTSFLGTREVVQRASTFIREFSINYAFDISVYAYS